MISLINKCFRYWNTLRYLKLVQIFGRIKTFFPKTKTNLNKKNHKNNLVNSWIESPKHNQKMFSVNTFDFLNEVHVISPNDWNNLNYSKLWLYNLHYFDDLNAHKSLTRVDWHNSYIDLWVDKNLPFKAIH